nr:hypothetical protein [Tanacetum cinerariifolium]
MYQDFEEQRRGYQQLKENNADMYEKLTRFMENTRRVPEEARSRWWVSSRAYFDGRIFEEEQIPRQLNRNNYFKVPSEMYQDFEEQRRGYQQLKEKNADMYEKLTRFMENTRRVPEAHTTTIIADQHFGVSDMSEFQSY